MKKILITIGVLILILSSIFYLKNDIQYLLESFANWAFPKNENRNGEVVKLILNIIAGIVITIGLYATIIRARATQRSVDKQDASIKNQTNQIELTRKSQTNDQFKNAIEHLGSDKEPIILGGISELHQIAMENKDQFSQVIFNILCSYLRTISHIDKDSKEINKTVLQTIVDYLFRTDTYINLKADLRFCNLISCNLSNINFKNSNFSFCHLPFQMEKTKFENCDLRKASGFGQYKNIEIINCDMYRLYFKFSSFENLKIINENKKSFGLTFIDCDFVDSYFSKNFFKDHFISCEFSSCEFKSDSIMNSHFFGSSFYKVNFKKVKEIYESNFSACGFEETDIRTDLLLCNFNGSDNNYKYFRGALEKRLEERTEKPINTSGLVLDQDKITKSTFNKLTNTDSENLLKTYQEIEEKYKIKRSKKEILN